MSGKPSLSPVPDTSYGKPRHPMRMPGYLQDRIGLAIFGMALAIIALVIAMGVLTAAFIAAKHQELPPIQGAIQMPDGTILNQELLHEADAADAAFRASVRDHIYRWRSVTNGLTVEQQWAGMEFRLGGEAATKLIGGLRDPNKQPGTVLANGLVRCTDIRDQINVVPSAGRPGWYEARWYEKIIRAGAPCPINILRTADNLRWAEFLVEIDPKPTAEKKRWNIMGITIMDYKTDVTD